jgi:hypothetical protein
MAVSTGAQAMAARKATETPVTPETAQGPGENSLWLCQLAVIAEHRSGAGFMPVSTGAQAMAVRWPPEQK